MTVKDLKNIKNYKYDKKQEIENTAHFMGRFIYNSNTVQILLE